MISIGINHFHWLYSSLQKMLPNLHPSIKFQPLCYTFFHGVKTTGCIRYGKVNGRYGVGTSAKDAYDCQRKCQARSYCKMFQFQFYPEVCTFFASVYEISPHSTYDFANGPKNCPGKKKRWFKFVM